MGITNAKEPTGGIKFLVVVLYIIGVIVQALLTYYGLTQ
jgi:hypothetical protein